MEIGDHDGGLSAVMFAERGEARGPTEFLPVGTAPSQDLFCVPCMGGVLKEKLF